MLLRVRVVADADREVDRAVRRHELEAPGTGRRFLGAYADSIAYIRQFPRMGMRLCDYEEPDFEVRSFVVSTVFPYTVFVALFDDEIVILAVAHQHQEPGYWAERISDLGR